MMVDTQVFLNDVDLAKQMLENADQNEGELSNSDIVFSLRNFLKMKYYPVAVKYFFKKDELEDFKENTDYKVAFHPYTFCHYIAASRQRGDILLGTFEKAGCTNAKYVMRWKELDDGEVKSHLKYTNGFSGSLFLVFTNRSA